MTIQNKNLNFRIVIYLCAAVLAAFYLLPVASMVITSLKKPTEVFSVKFFPQYPVLSNYIEVLKGNFSYYAKNSLILTISSMAISLFLGINAAYGFSRYRFFGQNFMFLLVLFIRLLPRSILLVPYYILLSRLGLTNTYLGLTLIYVSCSLPIAVWLLTAYFKSIPREIEETAKLDGCSTMGVIWRIAAPICAPGIAVTSIFVFIDGWNQFTLPLLLTRAATRPLAVGLVMYRQDALVMWHLVMTAAALMTLPFIIFFLIFQRHIIKGMIAGALKE